MVSIRRIVSFSRVFAWLAAVTLVFFAGTVHGQQNIRIRGFGLLGNQQLSNQIAFLNGVDQRVTVELSASFVEDTAFILLAKLQMFGHIAPVVSAQWQDGEEIIEIVWETPFEPQLESEVNAEFVTFQVQPGVLSFYETVEIEGIDALRLAVASSFIVPSGVLFNTRRSRVFTEGNLRERVERLIGALEARGYRRAHLLEQNVELDKETGAAIVRLVFEQGPVFRVRELHLVDGDAVEVKVLDEPVLHVRAWERDQRQELLNRAYREGYPDARVATRVLEERALSETETERDLELRLVRGDRISLSGVELATEENFRRALLGQRHSLTVGDPLNIIDVTEARRRLMGLGIYRSVDVAIEPTGPNERKVIFTPDPGPRKELSVQGGWGSYELARVGFRWQQWSPWGLAHRYEVAAKQSFKARSLAGRYTVPQIFNSNLTAFLRTRYLFREELSFDREIFGASLGTSFNIPRTNILTSVEYSIEQQEARRRQTAKTFQSVDRATVAGLNLRVVLDGLDNSLYPSSGYSLGASTLLSSNLLGADVSFQKLELNGSFHQPFAGSRVFHASLRYGYIFSHGSAAENIPFNERFFPGGENSVRGYQQGEASPVDERGNQLGAEAYVLGNIEVAQRVVNNFSVVWFADVVGTSLRASNFGTDEFLASTGLGLRYRSPVGPVRFEYGRNLNPRSTDPSGTFHFSIGFPF